MTTTTRLGAYGLGLLVAFAGAFGLGKVAGPVADNKRHQPAQVTPHDGHRPLADPPLGEAPGGLLTSQDGYRLAPVTTALASGAATDFAFRIVAPDGAPVTRYTPTHERDLHLIVVRRDLATCTPRSAPTGCGGSRSPWPSRVSTGSLLTSSPPPAPSR
jgi:hypothetical protein